MKKINLRSMAVDAMLLALLCACAFSIPAGMLKFTLQLLIVFMIGLLVDLSDSILIMFCYIIMGLIGLPVFGGYVGGIANIYNPTFGFVYGFIPGLIAMYFIKKVIKPDSKKSTKVFIYIIACLSCQLLCYIFGFLHGYLILNVRNEAGYTFGKLMMLFIVPYIPIDLGKMAIAILAVLSLEKPYQKLMNDNK